VLSAVVHQAGISFMYDKELFNEKINGIYDKFLSEDNYK